MVPPIIRIVENIIIGEFDSFIVRREEREAIGGRVIPKTWGQLRPEEEPVGGFLVTVGLGVTIGFLVEVALSGFEYE